MSLLGRPSDVEAFLAGLAFPGQPGLPGVPYPRARPADVDRLPADTWAGACVPVGVRVEVAGDAPRVVVTYETTTSDLGYRGAGAGTSFTSWDGDAIVDEVPAVLGEGSVTLDVAAERGVITLPEGMRPMILAVHGDGGVALPAQAQPRWLCYGDSIAEGWATSGPGRAWPALVGRSLGLDAVNLGYGGAARGEMVMAEAIASMPADIITIAHGTNCWQRVIHSAPQMAVGLEAFIDLIRTGHPETPIVVLSPIIRPDAEDSANPLGATLADIRRAMEQAVRDRQATDPRLWLVEGAGLVDAATLADGVHPGDAGHATLGGAVATGLRHALSVTAAHRSTDHPAHATQGGFP